MRYLIDERVHNVNDVYTIQRFMKEESPIIIKFNGGYLDKYIENAFIQKEDGVIVFTEDKNLIEEALSYGEYFNIKVYNTSTRLFEANPNVQQTTQNAQQNVQQTTQTAQTAQTTQQPEEPKVGIENAMMFIGNWNIITSETASIMAQYKKTTEQLNILKQKYQNSKNVGAFSKLPMIYCYDACTNNKLQVFATEDIEFLLKKLTNGKVDFHICPINSASDLSPQAMGLNFQGACLVEDIAPLGNQLKSLGHTMDNGTVVVAKNNFGLMQKIIELCNEVVNDWKAGKYIDSTLASLGGEKMKEAAEEKAPEANDKSTDSKETIKVKKGEELKFDNKIDSYTLDYFAILYRRLYVENKDKLNDYNTKNHKQNKGKLKLADLAEIDKKYLGIRDSIKEFETMADALGLALIKDVYGAAKDLIKKSGKEKDVEKTKKQIEEIKSDVVKYFAVHPKYREFEQLVKPNISN